MIYFCCDKLRRNQVRGSDLNGIDFLEVLDRDAENEDDRQRILHLHLLNDPNGLVFTAENIRIEGGERVCNIQVTDVTIGLDSQTNIVVVRVDRPGDFSFYTLRLVRNALDDHPPKDFDPLLSSVKFSFKVECPSEFDCKPQRICPPEAKTTPPIDYLAKDYASFRRLMLDRMAALAPQWRERNAADLGIALVELLAYVGDHLSYEQDAVATEAYVGTARRRISIRRHARLVDYFIDEGSNARAWVQIQVDADVVKLNPDDPPVLPARTPLFTQIPGQITRLPDDERILSKAEVVFETMHGLDGLYKFHKKMPFYTWSDERCCLPTGATRATLEGHFPHLQGGDEATGLPGDVLVFEEILDPKTGNPADADPAHRHAVRLTSVRAFGEDGDPLEDPLMGTPITEIEWSSEDALPFALCISADNVEDPVSVARGNIVLADHGRSIKGEKLGKVPKSKLSYALPADDRCNPPNPKSIPPRFYPSLKERPLTHAAPFDASRSARSAMHWNQRDIRPAITLRSELSTDTAEWMAKRDLLNSAADAPEFVVEIESDGTAFVRFGDDRHGRRPESCTAFTANYRVGNGVAGTIGVDSLVHILSNIDAISEVRNLTPSQGGTEPETIEDVRQRAPYAFHTQARAVTPPDYEEVTQRHPGIQKAAATFRWTGSWHTVFLTIDRKGGLDVDRDFEKAIRAYVEPFRMAGYDLEVDAPRFVSLEIQMFVCVKPEYFRSHVKEALLAVFSNQQLPNGRKGVFHPDNFTFGQTVYLSPLYAAAQDIAGVASVHIEKFQRQGQADPIPVQAGKLRMDRLEIARLDNDRNFPERGVFRLELGGGK